MLTLYAWSTPNGYKPLILLEELKVSYEMVPVNIGKGEQHEPAFLKLNPNAKIPALQDKETGITVWESGAILLYLAEKYQQFLPKDTKGKTETMTWLFFQMASVGPMLGQAYHFVSRDEKNPYGIERYTKEAKRILNVLNQRLQNVPYLAGDSYSITDMATWPWVRNPGFLQMSLDDFPAMKDWSERLQKRDAVTRALAVEFSKK